MSDAQSSMNNLNLRFFARTLAFLAIWAALALPCGATNDTTRVARIVPDSTLRQAAASVPPDSVGRGAEDEVCNNYTYAGAIGIYVGGSTFGSWSICANDYMPYPIVSTFAPYGAPAGATPEYIWVSSTASCPNSAFNIIPGATGASYTPTGTAPQTTYFARGVRNVGCTDYIFTYCATYNTNQGSNVVSSGTFGYDQTVCAGGDPAPFVNILSPSGGSGTINYMWLTSTTNCGAGFTISGATGQTYDPPGPIYQTTWYRRCVRTSSTCLWKEDACTQVTPNSVYAGAIGYDQTICSGGDPAAFVTTTSASGSGTLTYQWEYSLSSCSGPWSAIAGANWDSYDVGGGQTQTMYYRRVVTSTLNGVSCSAASNCVTVTPSGSPPTISGQPANLTVCSGSNATLSVTASGAASYQWESSPDGATWASISGANAASYTTSTLTTTTYYRVLLSASNGCSTTSSTATVAVQSPAAVSIATASSSICTGGAFATSASAAGGTGGYSFQWQYSNGGAWAATAIGTPTGALYSIASAGAASSFSVSGISVGGTYQYRVVVSSGACALAASSTATLTVGGAPSISPQPNGGTICVGSSTSMNIGATGAASYQWQYSPNGVTWSSVMAGTPTGATYSGATNTSLSLGGISAVGSYLFRCVASSAGCGSAASNAATVVVNAFATITTQPTNSTGCGGAVFSMSVANTGTPTYQWQYSADNFSWSNAANGTPFNATYTGATSAALSASGITAAGTHYYRNLLSAAGCASLVSNSAARTINAAPSVTANGNALCLGQTLDLTATVTGGTAPFSFSWQGPLGFSSTSPNPSFLVLFAGFGGNYTVSVVDSAGCTGQSSKVVTISSPPPQPCPIGL